MARSRTKNAQCPDCHTQGRWGLGVSFTRQGREGQQESWVVERRVTLGLQVAVHSLEPSVGLGPGKSSPACSHPQVAQLPLFVSDGKWHHICITWTTRDGMWEAFQDGEKLGTGENLAPWHPIKPGGVLILGQEQVGTLSGML